MAEQKQGEKVAGFAFDCDRTSGDGLPMLLAALLIKLGVKYSIELTHDDVCSLDGLGLKVRMTSEGFTLTMQRFEDVLQRAIAEPETPVTAKLGAELPPELAEREKLRIKH